MEGRLGGRRPPGKIEPVIKKIKAYVNTVQVHWLVEELEGMGIDTVKLK